MGPSDKTKMKLESISFLILSFAIAVSSFNHGRSELDSSAMRRLLISEFRDQMNQAHLGGYRNFATQKREHSNSNSVCNSVSQNRQEVKRCASVLEFFLLVFVKCNRYVIIRAKGWCFVKIRMHF